MNAHTTMPQPKKKQDYVDFIAAHAPKMSVASLRRVARCIAEETRPPKPKQPAAPAKAPKARVRFDDAALAPRRESPRRE